MSKIVNPMKSRACQIVESRESELWTLLRLFDDDELKRTMPEAAAALAGVRFRRPGLPRAEAVSRLPCSIGNAAPDIADFFECTNGLQLWPVSETAEIFCVKDVGLFSDLFPKPFRIWSTPIDDETEFGGPYAYRLSELAECVCISSNLDGSYLLVNTGRRVQNSFECWWLSSRHPGVRKFADFAEMLDEYLMSMVNSVRFALGNVGLL